MVTAEGQLDHPNPGRYTSTSTRRSVGGGAGKHGAHPLGVWETPAAWRSRWRPTNRLSPASRSISNCSSSGDADPNHQPTNLSVSDLPSYQSTRRITYEILPRQRHHRRDQGHARHVRRGRRYNDPRHVQTAGKPFTTTIPVIAEIFKGTDLPVSVEVNPHFHRLEKMVTEGKRLAAISPNFVIKLPATEPGFAALRRALRRGHPRESDAVVSGSHALQAMRLARPSSRPSSAGRNRAARRRCGSSRKSWLCATITASRARSSCAVRNGRQIVESAVAGADIVDRSAAVFQGFLRASVDRRGAEAVLRLLGSNEVRVT